MQKGWVVLLLVLVFMGCKKEIDELPEPTQTGENTFGATINDKLWGPLGFGIMPTAPILEAFYDVRASRLTINARNFASSPNESEMEIFLENVTGPGTYLLNKTTNTQPSATANYAYYVERRIRPTNEWMTNAQYPGTVTITRLDVANKVVSGTFAFKAINPDYEPEPLSVTDGRFDIKLRL
jgi:hypothetical protein